MSDAAIFLWVLGGLFVARIVAATVVFYFILPRGDRCPNCDAITLRTQKKIWNRLFPYLRTSWCLACGWEGALRFGPLSAPDATTAHHELSEHGVDDDDY
jgi:hypothetical protein